MAEIAAGLLVQLDIEVVHATVPLPLRFAIMLEMSERARKLLHDAMDLPVSERAGLAADLLASLDGEPEADVEAAWASEIERRAREALANPDDDVAWETVRAELRAAPTR
jgi:putative addiction module component (TIGR02574 family)